MTLTRSNLHGGGFTLVELIVVIVLLGILALGGSIFVARPIEIYQEQIRRQQLVDAAEMALRQIAIDVRRSLPNSLRFVDNGPNDWAIEVVETVDGARYRDEAGAPFIVAPGAEYILDFTTADDRFNILGVFSNNPGANLRVAIFSTNSADVYADAVSVDASNPFGLISQAGITLNLINGAPEGDEHQIILDKAHRFSQQSPGQRLFLVGGPVSYTCDTTNGLVRFAGYPFRTNHGDVDSYSDLLGQTGQSHGVVASDVSRCAMDYDPGSPTRSGLLTIELGLTNSSGDNVRLLHQLHVDNVP